MAAFLLAGAVLAEPALVFGPSPRALDNRSIFAPEAWPAWQALQAAGVNRVVLNPTFLMETDFQAGGGQGGYRERPPGTYLTDADLANLAQMVRETGIAVIYESGPGLSGDTCGGASPEEIGRRAALTEFDESVARLLAAGVPVAAINADGPFLRLVADSGKDWSCKAFATAKGAAQGGFDAGTAAEAALVYMAVLRDLIAEANPDAAVPDVHLVVNLPTWQVLDLPRRGNAKGRPTTDLNKVVQAFVTAQGARRNPLRIAEVVVDYPYDMVRADRELFRDRTKHLWNMTRRMNPGGDPPGFGLILNSGAYAHPCLKAEGPAADVPFLPFRRQGAPIGEACQQAQTGKDSTGQGVFDDDADYMADTRAYAAELQPGGVLDAALVTVDGTRIARRISHLYVQSWGINPLRNSWYMEELRALAAR